MYFLYLYRDHCYYIKLEELNEMSRCPFSSLFGKSSKLISQSSWIDRADVEEVDIHIVDPTILKQLEMIELTKEEVQVAKSIQSLIIQHSEEIVSSFYQTITRVDELKEIIVENSTIERLRKTLEMHLIEMFSGRIDEAYLNKRFRVANVHYRIGLEPKWYMGAFQNLQSTLLDIVFQYIVDRNEIIRISKVVTKILNFEQQIVLEAYEKENVQQRQLQYEKAKEDLKEKILTISQELTVITEQASSSVQDLLTSSTEVNSSISSGAEASRHTKLLAADGQAKLEVLESGIQGILERTNKMEGAVNRLNHSLQEISTFVNLVQEIAGQTNLLALNSAIEAARAGEYGRGFSVVAGEVRKLSEQTKQSVEIIKQNIVQTLEHSNDVVLAIQEVNVVVQDSKVESEATEIAFNHIVQSMTKSLEDVELVEKGMITLVQSIQEIGHSSSQVVTSAETLYQAAKNV